MEEDTTQLDFLERPTEQEVVLPPAFDMHCRKCRDDTKLEAVCMPFLTTTKPFTTLHCPKCHSYLYLFGDPKDPLIVDSKRVQGSTNFSGDVEQLFADRAEERKRKAQRSG